MRAQRETALALSVVLIAECAGVVLLVMAFVAYRRSADFVARAWPTQGVVIAVEGSSPAAPDRAIIRFDLPDGRQIRFRAAPIFGWMTYDVGDRLGILFDPAEPERVQLDTFWHLWTAPVVLGAMGALLAVGPAVGMGVVFSGGGARRLARRPKL